MAADFELMAFVDDQVMVFRKHPVLGGQIRHQQRVVDDQHMRAFRRLARAEERAGFLRRRAGIRPANTAHLPRKARPRPPVPPGR